MNTFERIAGLLIAGFAVRAASAVAAIHVATIAYRPLSEALSKTQFALAMVQP